MLAAAVNSSPAWLIPYSPNTADPVSLTATVALDTRRALTGARSSRPQQLALQCGLDWSVVMRAADYAALRSATQAAQDEPILVPLWPFTVPAAAALVVTSGLVVAWTRGWATWAINPGSFAAYDFKAPLLFGRLSQPPRLAGKNGLDVLAEFLFAEDGPAAYALVPPVAVDATFTTASGYAAPVFPFLYEGSTRPVPGAAVVEVSRDRVGPGRIQATTFYPQAPERVEQQSFKFKSAAAAAQLLGWWARRAGGAEAHWVATSQQIGTLAASGISGTNTLTFAGAPRSGANVDLALAAPGAAFELARIDALVGSVATLHANLARTWPAASTMVSLAMLARHTDEALQLDFRRAAGDWVAQSTLSWRECATEYTAPEGETRGVTLGRTPAAWWGFQIDLDYNGAIVTTRLTNWEGDTATVGGHDWAYNACSFPKFTNSIDLEDDQLQCIFTAYEGCPFENWLPGNLEAVGYITLWRADVAADGTFSNLRAVWPGEIDEVTPADELPKLSVKVIRNALFSKKFPRQLDGIDCAWSLLSPRCTLLRTDWSWSAVVVASAGTSLTLGTFVRTNMAGNPAGWGGIDWFALGYIEYTRAGAPRRTEIRTHPAVDGSGHIVLTLDRPVTFTVGASVLCVPECDLQGATCRAYDAVTNPTGKFDNYDHFGGFEDKPAIDPGFILPTKDATPAKK